VRSRAEHLEGWSNQVGIREENQELGFRYVKFVICIRHTLRGVE
jgi:hypothetical protein